MKKIWTKYLAVLCLVACVFSLTACSEDPHKVSYSKETEAFVEDALKSENMEQTVAEYAQAQVEGMVEQIEFNAINIDREELQSYYDEDPASYEYAKSYLEATKELGAYKDDYYDLTFEMDEDSVSMTGMLDFEKLDLKFNYSYDYVAQTMTLDFERELTIGEILQKAGMNTLLGMGTVFLVLILISLVIASLGILSNSEDTPKKENTTPAPKAPAVASTPVAPVQTAAPLPDEVEMAIVIATAIAAAEEETGSDGYRVSSIKRAKNSKWRRS